MSEEQVATFVSNPEMREALAVVLEQTRGGETEIEWSDVSDRLSSGQWGRLLQEGVLVGGTNGFRLDEPETVQHQLTEHGRHPLDDLDEPDEPGESSWARHDKVAGLAVLFLMMGYWYSPIRNGVALLDNLLLAPITGVVPFYLVILILAVVTGLYSTVLQSYLRDSEKIQAYQDRMERLTERKEAAKERGDDEALEQIREEQMDAAGDQLGLLKEQFRPMVWIMLLTIPVFLWLRWKIRAGHLGVAETGMVLPYAGHVGWQQAALGPMPTWIVWYFLSSLAARQIFQKMLNLRPN